MRYQVGFILDNVGYDYEASTRNEALFLYNLVKNTYPNCREVNIWDNNENEYIYSTMSERR